jgi:uncharacterized protein YoxC
MIGLSALLIMAVIFTATQIFLIRWLFKVSERLDEAKKTNYLLLQILDQKKL